MMRGFVVLALLAACGGGKKTPDKPVAKDTAKQAPPPETEEDRQKKRHAAALAIVPEGSKCLPAALKEDNAPRLDLAVAGKGDVLVCANDTDKQRLLGQIACWKVDIASGGLTYEDPTPMPGHSIDVAINDRCARGYCIPKEAKLDAKVAHMSWNMDGTKVAVLAGDVVHVFDAASKDHQASFSIRGEKGVGNDPIAVYFVGDSIFVEGADQGPFSAVWQFKAADGTPSGPLVGIGKDDKPISTYHGSFMVLDGNQVAIAERGFTTVTTYEVDSGKRTKAVRKLGKVACKPDELETFWKDGEKVSDKCKGSATSVFGTFIGATALRGKTNLLVMLRDDRLGELAVINPKSLAEDPKKLIKLPWCEAGDGAAKADAGGGKAEAAPAKDEAKKGTRGPTKKTKTGDPDEGGE
jgi:hypothetical protein